VIILLICAGLTFTLVTLDEGITSLLRWVGAEYILWLAWPIARIDPASGGEEERPVSFWASLGLQFVNLKIILYG
ncbi:amino acid transporter, partial [Klebsiella quasipneumoniae]